MSYCAISLFICTGSHSADYLDYEVNVLFVLSCSSVCLEGVGGYCFFFGNSFITKLFYATCSVVSVNDKYF